jgi:23S rRNA (guanosine2251-2'-O)-methyltransferase
MPAPQRVFGLHAVESLLRRDPSRVSVLLALDSRDDARMRAVLELAAQANVPVRRVARTELDERVPGVSHQGVLAETGTTPGVGEKDLPAFLDTLEGPPFILILDNVQDPHNLGACLRSADAAGVDLVIIPRDKSAPLSGAARKVACGAADTLPLVRVTNLARVMKLLRDRGVWIYGAAGEAEKTLYQTDLKGPLALVLGGEGRGLRRLTRDNCDGLAAIPLAGHVGSLNVSVATGICLFEALRQRSV